MYNKHLFSLLFFLFSINGFSQNCSLKLTGQVTDADTGEGLEFVNIFVQETQSGVSTDSVGYFEMNNLCSGDYHFVLSHIGCESQKIFIQVQSDSIINLVMDHSAHELHGVTITEKANNTTQNTQSISEQKITDNANKNLSNLLSSITGVSMLKNGTGISKPVVHGLYGNRLTILNNGIAQSGQQWGNDHSPEIDPLVANKIRVIKGTGSLEYMGANLGAVVLVEPSRIQREPHLHGSLNYFFESNGFGNGLNLQLQQYSPKIAWKINASGKKSGDKKTPDYFLNNTGVQESNIAIQLEKSFSDRFNIDLYFSSFNTELGVLRGSHIGNVTDLESALEQDVPFFTEDTFSYQLEAPKQKVNHNLLKIHSKFFLYEDEWIDITIAGQSNNRKEFDVRRGGFSEIPALSLLQYSLFAETKYQRQFENDFKWKTGIQFNFIDNTNDPETGVLPLIPDYRSFETGLYSVLSKKMKKSVFEIGVRYDNVLQNVVTISTTFPREIIRYSNSYNNLSGSIGYTRNFGHDFSMEYNLGYAMRNPGINELYSSGLHQGVSGIEEGSIYLESERSTKSTLGFQFVLFEKLSTEVLGYFQYIRHYIFLKPEDEFRLTIRGAFPVFRYLATDVQIYGLDLSSKLQISETVQAKVNYSNLRGHNLRSGNPLINMPSNNLTAGISYSYNKTISLMGKKLENLELELINQFVYQQSIQEDQDFVSPPDSYNLLGLKLSSDLQLNKTRWRIILTADNLLNTRYRDYLNRQRYFADDLGFNFSLGLGIKF